LVTTLKKGERGKGTGAQYAATNVSIIISFILFLLLNSKEFSKICFNLDNELVSNRSYLIFLSVMSILIIFYTIIFIKERESV